MVQWYALGLISFDGSTRRVLLSNLLFEYVSTYPHRFKRGETNRRRLETIESVRIHSFPSSPWKIIIIVAFTIVLIFTIKSEIIFPPRLMAEERYTITQ